MRKLNFRDYVLAEMSDGDALMAAIAANPGEATPYMVLADWLDDHDQPDLAVVYRRYGGGEPVVLPQGCARGNPVHSLAFSLTPTLNGMDLFAHRRGPSCSLWGYRFGNQRPFPVRCEFLARALPDVHFMESESNLPRLLMEPAMRFNHGEPGPLERFCQEYMDNYPWYFMREHPNVADHPDEFRSQCIQCRNDLNSVLRNVGAQLVTLDTTRLHPDNYPPF